MATRMKTKAAYREENRDRRPYAVARYIRISPKKVSIVLDLIRGKSVAEADAILEYTPKSSAPVVRKLLASATANAENNQMMNRDGLYVAETFVGPGPTLKRYRPRARGSAAPIRKRTSHITIILDEKE
jgi:large subunit ribosomal protein L22